MGNPLGMCIPIIEWFRNWVVFFSLSSIIEPRCVHIDFHTYTQKMRIVCYFYWTKLFSFFLSWGVFLLVLFCLSLCFLASLINSNVMLYIVHVIFHSGISVKVSASESRLAAEQMDVSYKYFTKMTVLWLDHGVCRRYSDWNPKTFTQWVDPFALSNLL